MRDLYHQQLGRLTASLADLCEQAGAALRDATTALLTSDNTLASRVIAGDRRIDRGRTSVAVDAQSLLALQAPVAGELRTVMTTIRITDRVERMGDLAVHVAESVRRRYPQPVLPELLRSRFAEMGRIAADLADDAALVVRHRDAGLARQLSQADDELDDLHRTLFTVIDCGEWNYGTRTAVDAVLLSRNYERFADHAVSIAGGMLFAISGATPRRKMVRDLIEHAH